MNESSNTQNILSQRKIDEIFAHLVDIEHKTSTPVKINRHHKIIRIYKHKIHVGLALY